MIRGRAFETEVREACAAAFGDTAEIVLPETVQLWKPNPGPQTAAFYSEADELFYGGAGGGGKSDLLLGLCVTAHRNSAIFRSEFTQFRGPDGMIERSKEIIGGLGDLNESSFQWRRLPGGRSFEFAAVKTAKDLRKWKGRPHDLKGFDEIPDIPEHIYRFLIGWLRTSIVGQRTRVVNTGNPPTNSDGRWVIRYWAPWLDKTHPNPAKDGELRWFATVDGKDVELSNSEPVTDSKGEVINPRSRTFIRARVEDNPYYIQTGYIDVLNNLPEPLRSQLRFGDFEATQDDDPWQGIPTNWARAAMKRGRETSKPDLPLTAIGNDPSRGGKDKFCITKRYGYWVAPVIKHEGKEAPDGQRGIALLQRAMGNERPLTLNIDIGGSAGSSVFDQARDLDLPAVALNGAEKSGARDASGRLGFFNKRAEWHWKMREALDPSSGLDIALPDDPELLADLCAWRWRITPRGIRIEEKLDIKDRIGRSPDVGESVIYAFAEDSGSGFGFLAYATTAVQAAKASTAAPATPTGAPLSCGHTAGVDNAGRCRTCLRPSDAPPSDDDNPWIAEMPK